VSVSERVLATTHQNNPASSAAAVVIWMEIRFNAQLRCSITSSECLVGLISVGRVKPAFVLARPPGHHALRDRGMGFCLFSNAAIAAYYTLEQPGIDRVAIWTGMCITAMAQAIVENHPACLLFAASVPCYPGTGEASRAGAYDNVLNLPLPLGTRWRCTSRCLRKSDAVLSDFQPDLLIVSGLRR